MIGDIRHTMGFLHEMILSECETRVEVVIAWTLLVIGAVPVAPWIVAFFVSINRQRSN